MMSQTQGASETQQNHGTTKVLIFCTAWTHLLNDRNSPSGRSDLKHTQKP